MAMVCTQFTTFPVNGKALQEKTSLPVTREADEPMHLESGVINLYPKVTYQTIEGFGGAMTETSAYLFSTMLPDVRKKALEEFFGKDGSGLSLIRVPMDSCDFSLEEYQAVPDPIADPELTTFSIERDRKYVLPALKEAIKMNEENGGYPIRVLLSPWSPPYQWKTPPEKPKNDAKVYGGPEMGNIDYEHPGRNNGGSLKPEYYGAWARYLTKYVQAYLDEGIPVTMMTLQNESIAATNWDSCVWSAKEQKRFLSDYLFPAFEQANLADKVGLFIWDHNKERMFEWSSELIDETTDAMIKGIAFHWYSGDHFEALQMTREAYPGKTLMLSECCGLHAPGQSSMLEAFGFPGTKTPEHAEERDAVDYAHDIIGNLNAGMNRWIDWNLCVDETGGPRHVPGGFTAGMIVRDGHYRTNLTYHFIGHFSRFMKPGAIRIGFSRPDSKAEVTAAKNPDGSLVLVALNRSGEDAFYALRLEGKVVRFNVPSGTITTIVLDNKESE